MNIGDEVPDFELPDQDGHLRRLSRVLENGPVVLFFYPAAMSPGCTKESCYFRDLAGEFAAVGATRVGISRDAVEKQKQFSDRFAFDYPLLADTDGSVARAFGVKRRFGPLPVKRSTFVIGTDRRVRSVISSELNMTAHADRALSELRSDAPGR